MAQVESAPPAEMEAHPEVTPEVVATGTGTVTLSEVLPNKMPSWPLEFLPARVCV